MRFDKMNLFRIAELLLLWLCPQKSIVNRVFRHKNKSWQEAHKTHSEKQKPKQTSNNNKDIISLYVHSELLECPPPPPKRTIAEKV